MEDRFGIVFAIVLALTLLLGLFIFAGGVAGLFCLLAGAALTWKVVITTYIAILLIIIGPILLIFNEDY